MIYVLELPNRYQLYCWYFSALFVKHNGLGSSGLLHDAHPNDPWVLSFISFSMQRELLSWQSSFTRQKAMQFFKPVWREGSKLCTTNVWPLSKRWEYNTYIYIYIYIYIYASFVGVFFYCIYQTQAWVLWIPSPVTGLQMYLKEIVWAWNKATQCEGPCFFRLQDCRISWNQNEI
jgi:hypothetical protein